MFSRLRGVCESSGATGGHGLTFSSYAGDVLVNLFHLVPWGPIIFSHLEFADLVAMCAMYPSMMDLLTAYRRDIDELRQQLDVRAALGLIPSVYHLRLLIEAFEPVELVIRCGLDETFAPDLLSCFGDGMRFELSFLILNDAVRLFPHRFFVYFLSISLSSHSQALSACHSILSSARGVEWLKLENVTLHAWVFSPVCAYNLSGFYLADVWFVSGITPLILGYLVSCRELTHVILRFVRFWSHRERHFIYRFMAEVSSMENLRELELTLGGAGIPLDGLLSLSSLRCLTIHLEIHCADLLLDRLAFMLLRIHLPSVKICFFCGDHSRCSGFDDRIDFIKGKLCTIVCLEIIFCVVPL